MVATLIRLRWRLLLNALTRSIGAMIGTIFGVLYTLGGITFLFTGAVGLGHADLHWISVGVIVFGALMTLGWILIPLLLTGTDSTLDPRAMSAWISPSRSLARALAIAASAGLTGIASAVAFLAPCVAWFVSGHIGAGILAFLLMPVALMTCVLASRIVVIGLGVARSRRWRELAMVVGTFVILVAAFLPQIFLNSAAEDWSSMTGLVSDGATVLGLTPLAWFAAAPAALAEGAFVKAVVLTLASLALPVVLLPLWEHVVCRVMSGPARSASTAHAYGGRKASKVGGKSRGPQGVDPLPWHRRLSRILPSPAAAVAARCLRYWRRDPRYVVASVSYIFIGIVVAMPVMTPSSSGEDSSVHMAWGHAPAGLIAVPILLSVVLGWALANDLAYDSTALWQHISAGMSGRHDRLGRLAACAVWQLPLVALFLLTALGWSGRWEWLPGLSGLCMALYGAMTAWSLFSNVLLPYEAIAPGESPLKSKTSGMAFIGSMVQLLSMLAVPVLCSPVITVFVLAALNDSVVWEIAALLLGIVWMVGLQWISVVRSGSFFDKRAVQVLTTIRSWPGHAEIR